MCMQKRLPPNIRKSHQRFPWSPSVHLCRWPIRRGQFKRIRLREFPCCREPRFFVVGIYLIWRQKHWLGDIRLPLTNWGSWRLIGRRSTHFTPRTKDSLRLIAWIAQFFGAQPHLLPASFLKRSFPAGSSCQMHVAASAFLGRYSAYLSGARENNDCG